MKTLFITVLSPGLTVGIAGLLFAQNPLPAPSTAPLYNTAKKKLLEGKQVFSFTQSKPDPVA